MKRIVSCLILSLLSLRTFGQEVQYGTIIVNGKSQEIRFINHGDESYISWIDLQRAMPMLFSLTEKGEITVNSLVFAPSVPIRPPNSGTPSGDVIESKIDGTFEGWEGDTIFKLTSGQIWQQTEYSYTYHYAYRPDVLIYRSGSVFKMKVEGVSKEIRVKRLK